MARVTIELHEELPAVCMICGQAASEKLLRVFKHRDISLGADMATRVLPIRMPVCPVHRHYWWAARLQEATLAAIVFLAMAIAVSPNLLRWFLAHPWTTGSLIGVILSLLAISTSRMNFCQLKPTAITGRRIVLDDVSEAFASALFALRTRRDNELIDRIIS